MSLKPGVCVLAMDDGRNVDLTEEFHYGVGRTTLEAVSGGIEPGNATLATARKVLPACSLLATQAGGVGKSCPSRWDSRINHPSTTPVCGCRFAVAQ